MKIELFFEKIEELGIDFYTGVPDSQLKELCDSIVDKYGVCDKHVVAANEGASVGLAAGHYLATGNPALVYMQNSGIGNAVNPICSLLNDKVYAIPALFVVGWRGEPGIKDEPQHVYQGEITLDLLNVLGIKTFVLEKNTTTEQFIEYIEEIHKEFDKGHQCAFVVRKGAFESDVKVKYSNQYKDSREDFVNVIADHTKEGDIFVSTTGKLSRELFEAREARNQGHKYDFLTVGSMGHASMIALAIALTKKDKKVYCLDGDGAVLMHMGSLAVSGANNMENYIHIMINNEAHETVGGIPTVSNAIDFLLLAKACGYKKLYSVETKEDLQEVLSKVTLDIGPVFIEAKTNLLSRSDLGRPTTTPVQNKEAFMNYLQS